MKKLNGWKRIGVIASVIWILGAGAYTYVSESTSEVIASIQCETKPGFGDEAAFLRCVKNAHDSLGVAEVVALAAFVPVPLGWGFVYLVLFLVRWVKRGFMRPL